MCVGCKQIHVLMCDVYIVFRPVKRKHEFIVPARMGFGDRVSLFFYFLFFLYAYFRKEYINIFQFKMKSMFKRIIPQL